MLIVDLYWYIFYFLQRTIEVNLKAGNVVTGEMVEELVLSGADIIKVGIGPGSVCTTRSKTGVGYPQLSAVLECADSAHGLSAHIISVSEKISQIVSMMLLLLSELLTYRSIFRHIISSSS